MTSLSHLAYTLDLFDVKHFQILLISISDDFMIFNLLY